MHGFGRPNDRLVDDYCSIVVLFFVERSRLVQAGYELNDIGREIAEFP